MNINKLLSKAYEDNNTIVKLQELTQTDEIQDIIKKYLPKDGEGNNMATQLVTALNKLTYKFLNDGDKVEYDGIAYKGNDLTSYANYLWFNIPELKDSLKQLSLFKKGKYAEALYNMLKLAFNEKFLSKYASKKSEDSVYDDYDKFSKNHKETVPFRYSDSERDRDYDESVEDKVDKVLEVQNDAMKAYDDLLVFLNDIEEEYTREYLKEFSEEELDDLISHFKLLRKALVQALEMIRKDN